jgi:type I restriction enzyme R subunit
MAKKKKAPELTFQQHVADYLVLEHKYGVLEKSDITDTEHFIAEGQLWGFLKASQADTLKKLEDDYGTDAREEVFKALRKDLEHTPLWMLFRQGLPVRGLEFRLFYPKPRSAASAAASEIRREPHHLPPALLLRRRDNQEIDFVFYLNGLPIVALELKHEANQTCTTPWRSSPGATTRTRSSGIPSSTSPPTPATRRPPPTRAGKRTSAGTTWG